MCFRCTFGSVLGRIRCVGSLCDDDGGDVLVWFPEE